MPRTIGLLGGTFNPVHEGHLSIAREAMLLFGLDAVWFIPCAVPPHKPSTGLAPNEHRLAMLRLAIAGAHPYPVRSDAADAALSKDGLAALPAVLEAFGPLRTDSRASAEYRLALLKIMLRTALEELA